MSHKEIGHRLPGYENCNTIEIYYQFPDGIQGVSMFNRCNEIKYSFVLDKYLNSSLDVENIRILMFLN